MVVHVVLLAVPAAASGFMHAFKFAVVLWPFNLVLPLLRNLPRVCATLQSAVSHYAAELRAYLGGRPRTVPLPPLGDRQVSYSSLRGVQTWSADRLLAHGMIALVDISY